MSLRQFRERAAEITEPVEVTIRDRDGNFRALGFYTPYLTYPVTLHGTGKIEQAVLPPVEITIPGPRVIKTPEDVAAAVAPRGAAYPKEVQAGRKKR